MTGVQTCALPICFPVTIRRGYILKYYRKEIQRLEENEVPDMNEGYGGVTHRGREAGSKAISLPASTPDYSMESYMRGLDE